MTHTDSRILKKLWWCYFALVALTTISSWFRIQSALDAMLAVFNGYALVGLWGYLRSSAIGWRKFWAVYFVLFMLSAAYSIGMVAWAAALSHTFMLYCILAVAILLCAPQCFALWRYAFRNTSIWQAARVAA
jgi:hypothetical protein